MQNTDNEMQNTSHFVSVSESHPACYGYQ